MIHISNTNENKKVTVLSNEIIDCMVVSNHTYSMIYIIALRNKNEFDKVCSKEIAKELRLLESDVVNAFEYWQEKGFIKINRSNGEVSIEFKDEAQNKQKIEKDMRVKYSELAQVLERKTYSLVELEKWRQSSEEIQDLFTYAQQEFAGKLFDYNELNMLFGLYDWLKIPIPVIKYLIEYCCIRDHADMKYIEKVALDWHKNDIQTVEEAKKYLSVYNAEYRAIIKACGHTRKPTPTEIKYMNEWLVELKIDLDVILHCVDYAVMRTGKGGFPYIDKTLKAWHEKGLKTIDDVLKCEEEFRSNKEQKKATFVKTTPVKKEKHKNFGERKIDNNELKNLEKMYIEKMLKQS